MIFSSLTFIYLIIPMMMGSCALVEIIYRKNKKRVVIENMILVLISLLFFSWANIEHIKVLLSLVIINYLFGIMKKRYKAILIIGVILNLFILIYFKYISMILQTLDSIFKGKTNSFEVVSPLGISFIIFHCVSYLIDLYNDNAEPCYSIINLGLYITFFPKLIQGPIVKYKDMRCQIEDRKITVMKIGEGLERFIIGLAKKVLIADILSLTVADIFDLLPIGMDIGTAWLGSLLFTLQIYFDFSSYSDMAIGLSKMVGFDLKENFNFPYLSKSISEFWRRWHISLGAWFREYLYFPLGGSKRGNVYFNLFVVFLATGVWHGSTWIYLLWGMMNGMCVVCERFFCEKEIYKRIPVALKWCGTMFIVNIGWICFRVEDVGQFIKYLKYMFGMNGSMAEASFTYQYFLTHRVITIIIICCLGICILGNKKIWNKITCWNRESKVFNIGKSIVLLGTLVVCYITIVSTNYSPFIYFQY